MEELNKIGFVEIDKGHWIRNDFFWIRTKKLYLIWNEYSESFNFYKVINDETKISDLKNSRHLTTVNGYFLDYIDMYHYSEVVNKIVAYLRKERILQIIDEKTVPRCPSCGHNFYEGGYGICKWCIAEWEEENKKSN